MNKNLLNQEEDVNAKWNGIGFGAHILTCYLFWSRCLKVLIEGVFLGWVVWPDSGRSFMVLRISTHGTWSKSFPTWSAGDDRVHNPDPPCENHGDGEGFYRSGWQPFDSLHDKKGTSFALKAWQAWLFHDSQRKWLHWVDGCGSGEFSL